MKTKKLAEELIGFETVSPITDSDIFLFVEDYLEDRGVEVDIVSNNGVKNLVATIKGSEGSSVCLSGHLDVVEPGEGWNTDPFIPVEKNGRIYGRGATDMKGEAAAMIKAFARLANNEKLNGDVTLMLTGDEEVGGRHGTEALVERYYGDNNGFDYCIVGEPTDLNIQIGTRGALWVDVFLEGENVHASRHENANPNTMNQLPKALEKLNQLELEKEGEGILPDPTLAVTTVDADNTYNSVPSQVQIGLDVRYSAGMDAKKIIHRIRRELKGLNCNVNVEKRVDHGGDFILKDPEFKNRVARAIKEVTGVKPDYITEGGASDGRFFADKGTPYIELGLNQKMVHRENEWCSIQKLNELEEIYYQSSLNLLNRRTNTVNRLN